jgi:3-hydroxy-9,10-secoandrosta-1,3,5(10)-triene-9,17-dione monooxygenase
VPHDKPSILIPNSKNTDWLDPSEVKSLTPNKILSRLAELRDLIAANARQAEQLRRPVDEVWSAIRKTGIYYMYVPKKFGGLESGGLKSFVDTVSLIGEGCASTAWCVAFSIYHQWFMVQFPEKFQQEIWGRTPYFTSAGSGFPPGKAVKAPGGFRVTGRWKWGSGIMHSEWANSIALLDAEDGTKIPYFVFAPIDEVQVLDTWDVDGMCGTGSHDYQMQDVFIPEHRAVDFRILARGQLHHENPFYRLPLAPALALIGVVPALGAARGAVKRFRERLASGGTGFRDRTATGKAVDKPMMQAALGKADMQVTAAEFVIRNAAAEFEEFGRREGYMSVQDRVRVRSMFAYAAEQCRAALRTLNDDGGSSAHFLSSPAQRALRDVTVIVTHKIFDFSEAMELQGRILTGLPSNNDWFE